MDMREVSERVRQAIGAVWEDSGKSIHALLFADDAPCSENWTWDEQLCCGIPVYHVTDISDFLWGRDVMDCPFIPASSREAVLSYHDRVVFADAYCKEVNP